MPENDNNIFDPHLDYDRLTDEHVVAFHEMLKRYRTATELMILEPSRAALAEVLKSHEALAIADAKIREELLVVPMMVHTAGPIVDGQVHESLDTPGKIQNCMRCGSMLAMWHDALVINGQRVPFDEAAFWEEGQRIAKLVHGSHAHMNVIEPSDRPLEKHEIECVIMPDINFTTEEE